MANFFSADYWKALYFKALGGQATAVDPNAMRGTFAGTSSFVGSLTALSDPNAMSGTFAGTSTFTGSLTDGAAQQFAPADNLVDRLHRRSRAGNWRRRWPPEKEVAPPEPVVVDLPPPKVKKIKKGLLNRLGKEPERQQTAVILEMARQATALNATRRSIDDLDTALKAIGAPRLNAMSIEKARAAADAIKEEAEARLAEIEEEEEERMLLIIAATVVLMAA